MTRFWLLLNVDRLNWSTENSIKGVWKKKFGYSPASKLHLDSTYIQEHDSRVELMQCCAAQKIENRKKSNWYRKFRNAKSWSEREIQLDSSHWFAVVFARSKSTSEKCRVKKCWICITKKKPRSNWLTDNPHWEKAVWKRKF